MNPYSYVKNEPYKLYINGEFIIPEKEETFDVINPVTNEPFAKTYKAGKGEVEMAVKAAREAYDNGPWGKMSAKDRSKLLLKAGKILERRLEEFACIETLECGKLFGSVMNYEGAMCVDAFEYFAGKTRCIEGKVVPIDHNTINFVQWYPHGVVGETFRGTDHL